MKSSTAVILSLFFIVIFGPLFFAWYMVEQGSAQLRLNHHGELIVPVRNIPTMAIGKWSLVAVSKEKNYELGQMHKALGKDSTRVHVLFVDANETFVDGLYIIDPKGNMMMHYPHNIATRDVLSDLKRLLRVSKIG